MSEVVLVPGLKKREFRVLVLSIFIIAACGLFYELLISTVSSYFLGSSITHFSITIGLFMFFMGVGSYLSKYILNNELERFVLLEIGIGLLGGLSAALLYAAFSLTEYYYLVALSLIAFIGMGIGIEIPLVTRLAHKYQSLKDALAHMLAFDYVGALLASLLFPLILLPYLGVLKSSFLIGLLNLGIALFNLHIFRAHLAHPLRYLALTLSSMLVLGIGLVYSFSLTSLFESYVYQDEVIYSEQSKFQKIILTKYKDDIRLFLNGNLQFSSTDEYRYHEALVHLPLLLTPVQRSVLILGGGDGLAAREVLKHPNVERIVLVDLDPAMTNLGQQHALLKALNQNSLLDARVEIINQDALKYLETTVEKFNSILIDLPDPDEVSLGKLYTKEFYSLVKRALAADGVMVTQSTSPYAAREAFWSINQTLEAVFPKVMPYHVYVPSFGIWGFNIAGGLLPRALPEISEDLHTKFLSRESLPGMFSFDPDTERIAVTVNSLDNQALVEYYSQSWEQWN